MPNVKDCPGFETFGAAVQQAREAVKMSRRELAAQAGIAPRYPAPIDLRGTIPRAPAALQLTRPSQPPAAPPPPRPTPGGTRTAPPPRGAGGRVRGPR